MCQPVKNYLEVIREYTREFMTFGGFALAIFVYTDFKSFVGEMNQTNAETVRVLQEITTDIHDLKDYHARESAAKSPN